MGYRDTNLAKLPLRQASVAQLDARLVIRGCRFDPCRVWQHYFMEINPEIFSILSVN